MVRAAVIGAPGYAGVELTRLLLGHPHITLVAVTSSAEAGRRVDDVYPALSGSTDLVYSKPDLETLVGSVDVAFLAVPHTAALDLAPRLIDAGIVVVDASADFRLDDPRVYEAWYGVQHTASELLGMAVYGLPEIDRSRLPEARLIACPGCYPTATLLAAIPALESGVAAVDHVIVDAKSGVSGAGRSVSAATHYPTVNEAVQPYKVGTHRHTPEIAQELARAAGAAVGVTFTPHLVPMTRGLLATVYLRAAEGLTLDEAFECYSDRYVTEPFVRVHQPGRMPSTAEVRGTNRAHIGVALDDSGSLVVACAIDNLVKGTAGQAVQCANLALGFEETAGLLTPAPVV